MNQDNSWKTRLSVFLNKQRADFYKAIQVAEVLYRWRLDPDSANPLDLESYRILSKQWRDEVSRVLLGKSSTSSAKFQDNLWEENAIPPNFMLQLHHHNIRELASVEKFIYQKFSEKRGSLDEIFKYLEVCVNQPDRFSSTSLIDLMVNKAGMIRSMDKVYEILTFTAFSALLTEAKITVQAKIGVEESQCLPQGISLNLLSKAKALTGCSGCQEGAIKPASIYRAGVANAADRGIDMWSNFGPIIQVKHLDLNCKIATQIVESSAAKEIIVSCRTVSDDFLQVWKAGNTPFSRIIDVITLADLDAIISRVVSNSFNQMSGKDFMRLFRDEFKNEFKTVDGVLSSFMKTRGYC